MNFEAGSIDGGGQTYALPGSVPAKRPRRVRLIVGIIMAVAVLIGAWFAFRAVTGGGQSAAAKTGDGDREQRPNVSVVVPGRGLVARTLTANGSLAARRDLPVGVAGEGGRVTRVLVEPGDWVAKGQVLALVDRSVQTETAASLAAGVAVARSDAAIAKSEYDRAQALVGRGFIAKADLERKAATLQAAEARVKVAQAQLAETQARNGRLDIRAPEAGLILTRAVEPGQIVSSGSGILFRMAQGGEMEMRAELSESDLQGVPVGARAKVTPVGSDRSFDGQIWQIAPIIDQTTRRGVARIALSFDKELRPGGFANATITSGGTSAPVLPNSAVLSDDRGNFVYIVRPDDTVERRAVTIGEVSDTGVAIASGLDGNERVVVSAGAFLNPGQKIAPVLKRAGA